MQLNLIRKLQTEILKRHLGPFLFCFLIVMFLLLMQFLILHIDNLIGKGIPLPVILELIATNLAYMVVLAVPMSVLVSCLMAFGKFSELNEFTAIRAAGINPLSIIRPILVAAAGLSIFLVYFSNEILPDANYKARSLFLDIRMQRPGFDLQENVFYDGIDGYNFLVRSIPAASDSLYDVTLFREGSDRVEPAVIKADSGYLTSVPDTDILSLFLYNGTINRDLNNSPDGKVRVERTRFNSYRVNFDLSDLSFSRTDPNRRRRDDRTMSSQMMLAIVDSLHRTTREDLQTVSERKGATRLFQLQPGDESPPEPIPQDDSEIFPDTIEIQIEEVFFIPEQNTAGVALAAYQEDANRPNAPPEDVNFESRYVLLNQIQNLDAQIHVAGNTVNELRGIGSRLSSLSNNHNWRVERTAQYMVEVHKKVSIPIGCIIFVLVGAPLGILTRKGNLGFNALISTILFTYYWITVIQGEKLADRLIVSPFWGMWFGNITLLLLGIYLMAKVMYEFRFSDLWQNRFLKMGTQKSGEQAS